MEPGNSHGSCAKLRSLPVPSPPLLTILTASRARQIASLPFGSDSCYCKRQHSIKLLIKGGEELPPWNIALPPVELWGKISTILLCSFVSSNTEHQKGLAKVHVIQVSLRWLTRSTQPQYCCEVQLQCQEARSSAIPGVSCPFNSTSFTTICWQKCEPPSGDQVLLPLNPSLATDSLRVKAKLSWSFTPKRLSH